MIENSIIIIKRDRQYADSLRSYRVFLDDREIGTVSRHKEKEFHISPGKHIIQLKIDWCKSNQLEFEIERDQVINFICGTNLKGLKILIGFIYVLIRAKNYLYIKTN